MTTAKSLFWSGCIVVCLSVSSVGANAQPLRTVDVSSFDVDGVKLGMSGADAIRALKIRFGAKAHLEIESMMTTIKPSVRRVDEIRYSTPTYTLDISFADATSPTKQAPEQVKSVVLSLNKNIPDLGLKIRSLANDFYQDVRAKYGAPTANASDGEVSWCSQTTEVGAVTAYPCDPFAPYMKWRSSDFYPSASLELRDDQADRRVMDYYKAHVAVAADHVPL